MLKEFGFVMLSLGNSGMSCWSRCFLPSSFHVLVSGFMLQRRIFDGTSFLEHSFLTQVPFWLGKSLFPVDPGGLFL